MTGSSDSLPAGRRGRNRIWFVGPLPPALSGQTRFNAVLAERLARFAALRALPTGGSASEKIWRAILNPLRLLFGVRRGDTIYCSAPGQMGLWLFLPTIAALRLRRLPHFVHHHSYRAVALAPLASHRWLCRIGGPRQRHVFLCDSMREGYSAAYLSPAQAEIAMVVPNAFLFAAGLPDLPRRDGPVVVAHLSVITREKGIDHILDLQRRLADDPEVEFLIGGPIADPALRATVEAAVAASGGKMRWIGPVEGQAKADFYARSDIFVLPTRLIDEADPLVLLESYSAGVGVLAAQRGCIPDRLVSPDHTLTFELEADAARLRAMIAEVRMDRVALGEACQRHAAALNTKAAVQGRDFLEALGERP